MNILGNILLLHPTAFEHVLDAVEYNISSFEDCFFF